MNSGKSAQERHFDVIAAGAGPAGLAAGLMIARTGAHIAVIGPRAPNDFRVSALMAGSTRLLEQAGVWQDCLEQAAALERLRIVDDTGRLLRAPEVLFHASEIGEEAFAWNIANNILVAALEAEAEKTANLTRIVETVNGAQIGDDFVDLSLSDGASYQAQLVIAADGRRSALRDLAGINTRSWRYPQVAMVVNATHSRSHNNVSTEFHRTTGPFTLVPLPGLRTAIVAVESEAGAEHLMALDDAALGAELETRSHRILGKMTVEAGRATFPLGGLVPDHFAKNRIMLVGESAHVVPPIGAQGLNLGLRDAAAAAEAVASFMDDPGCDGAMDQFDRARRGDIESRSTMIDLLNRSLLSPLLPAQMARSLGMAALRDIGPLRKLFMREGMEHGGARKAG